MIEKYNKMKNNIVNTEHEEAEKILENFKKENKEMLADREIMSDFVDSTIQTSANHKSSSTDETSQIDKKYYELLNLISCIINIFFTLYFKIPWLILIIMLLSLIIKFLIHLIIIDYDFLDNKFLLRTYTFFKNDSCLYSMIYIIITVYSDLSFYEIFSLIVMMDFYLIILTIAIFLFPFQKPNIMALKYFGIIIEYFYLTVMIFYLIVSKNNQIFIRVYVGFMWL